MGGCSEASGNAVGRQAAQVFDMHCHLDFAADADAAAKDAAARPEIAFFSNTVEPAAFLGVRRAFESCPNVGVGLGWHPWWVPAEADGVKAGLALIDRLAQECAVRLFGEVGLDYAPAHAATAENQRAVFDHVLGIAAARPGSTVSIHCVRAYDDALDSIGRSGAAQTGACVFHWFSGTSDQLQRAIGLGCWFSVGQRMLETKRGRAYAKAIPAGRLLLESDLPGNPGEPDAVSRIAESLERTLELLCELRGEDLRRHIAHASAPLLF